MAKGWVTTARGEQLNLDQLILDSKRPLNAPKEQKSEVKKRVIPKRRPINVRGYKPDGGQAKVPEMPEEMKARMAQRIDAKKASTQERKVAYRDGGVAETYADLTGVKLKPTEAAVERAKARMTKSMDEVPEQAAEPKDEALEEILEELEGHDEDVPEPEKKTTRRRTRKST